MAQPEKNQRVSCGVEVVRADFGRQLAVRSCITIDEKHVYQFTLEMHDIDDLDGKIATAIAEGVGLIVQDMVPLPVISRWSRLVRWWNSLIFNVSRETSNKKAGPRNIDVLCVDGYFHGQYKNISLDAAGYFDGQYSFHIPAERPIKSWEPLQPGAVAYERGTVTYYLWEIVKGGKRGHELHTFAPPRGSQSWEPRIQADIGERVTEQIEGRIEHLFLNGSRNTPNVSRGTSEGGASVHERIITARDAYYVKYFVKCDGIKLSTDVWGKLNQELAEDIKYPSKISLNEPLGFVGVLDGTELFVVADLACGTIEPFGETSGGGK